MKTTLLAFVLVAAVVLHALVQGLLAGMSERRMAEIVAQGNAFGEVLVDA